MRLLMSLVGVLCVAAPVCGQENEAEKLFHAMEKKIRSAKTVRVIVDSTIADGAMKGTFKGDFRAAGEKYNVLLDLDFAGKAFQLKFISDGKQAYMAFDAMKDVKDVKPGEKRGEQLVAMVARGGLLLAFKGGRQDEPDVDKAAPGKDFKLGAKAKIGNRDTQIVEYKLTPSEGPAFKVSVWIDTATQLPVKREVVGEENGKEARVVENYTTFNVDAKMEAKDFELPK